MVLIHNSLTNILGKDAGTASFDATLISFLLSMNESMVAGLAVTWKVLDICLGKFLFCLSFERYQFTLRHLSLIV